MFKIVQNNLIAHSKGSWSSVAEMPEKVSAITS